MAATERDETLTVMDPAPARYAPANEADVIALIRDHPLAWIVSAPRNGFAATPLPLRPMLDEKGALVGLKGHFARTNPQVELLRGIGRALILFMGPHDYISASWFSDRTQAPTWNYAAAAFDCELTLVEDPTGIAELLNDLIEAMEAGRPAAWSADQMNARFDRLAQGVLGFQAKIIGSKIAFKMGQEESEAQFQEILNALNDAGNHELASAMSQQRKVPLDS